MLVPLYIVKTLLTVTRYVVCIHTGNVAVRLYTVQMLRSSS
jgi:hypothetical protein